MKDFVKAEAIPAALPPSVAPNLERGKWMALTAALLGWMFDGLEMGLFPQAGRPALKDLLQTSSDTVIGPWFGVAMATFLVGAATGGVVFGWLGDRLGRVRAMTASVLCYALFTGLGAVVQEAWQLVALRFIAALGMGGEWSLGVALVNEIWPGRSRAFLAGLIGAAANVGFLAVGVIGIFIPATTDKWNIPFIPFPVEGWRLLLFVGAAPALLTFFIRLFVPESAKWEREHGSGATGHWATRDLLGVVIGAAGACLIIALWAATPLNAVFGTDAPAAQAASDLSALWWGLSPNVIFVVVIVGSLFGLVVATLGFLYPVKRYLERSAIAEATLDGAMPTARHRSVGTTSQESRNIMSDESTPNRGHGTPEAREQYPPSDDEHDTQKDAWQPTIKLMLIGACLSGIALLGTWGSVQWAPTWADQLTSRDAAAAAQTTGAAAPTYYKQWTQILSGLGAIFGTIIAAFMGDWLGWRWTYCLLCVGSLASILAFYRPDVDHMTLGWSFLFWAFIMGGITASFYGWLPLYLPELFPTRIRATGQGFAYNFGRILAAIGALQTGALTALFAGHYPQACTAMSLLYLAGVGIIWLAPETRGKPLPE